MSDEIRTEQLDDEKEHERLRKIVEEKMPPEEDPVGSDAHPVASAQANASAMSIFLVFIFYPC